jgi:hypothetical protein
LRRGVFWRSGVPFRVKKAHLAKMRGSAPTAGPLSSLSHVLLDFLNSVPTSVPTIHFDPCVYHKTRNELQATRHGSMGPARLATGKPERRV